MQPGPAVGPDGGEKGQPHAHLVEESLTIAGQIGTGLSELGPGDHGGDTVVRRPRSQGPNTGPSFTPELAGAVA
jgi:hypothetical protein